MKTIIAVVGIVIGILIGQSNTPQCMDPNTNTPIDCQLLSQ